MQNRCGRISTIITTIIKIGTTFKNLLFIFCDFIKHPIANKIKDNIKITIRLAKIAIKPIKKIEDTIFSKLFI